MTIIVVDDEPEIRDIVKEYLSDEGFDVREANDGTSLFGLIRQKVPELVLLDLKLPNEDGFTIARRLREQYPSIGIFIISGKEDVVDRVAGLEVGADDYLVKPFNMREVLARVKSILRRRGFGQNGQTSAHFANVTNVPDSVSGTPETYTFSGWTLDCSRRSLVSSDGKPVELTSGEFDLLLAFVSHPNRALSREQLLDYSRNGRTEAFDRSIDVQVGRLRRKIEHDHRKPALIKTIRNIGYMFRVDEP
jgi:DNA-binding response OmpR family regulator